MSTDQNVFAGFRAAAYPHHYRGTLLVRTMAGGIPANPKTAEGWIRAHLTDRDDEVRALVAKTMVERGVDMDAAAEIVADQATINGFKRDSERKGELYIEGRCLKSCLKEAASIAVAAGKLSGRGWGATNKGLKSFLAEHIFVQEEKLHLGVTEPAGIATRFVTTFRGTGIQREEYVEDVKIDFTVATDWEFSEKDWAMIWLTAGENGFGSARSQGYGRFDIIRWEEFSASGRRKTTKPKGRSKAAA